MVPCNGQGVKNKRDFLPLFCIFNAYIGALIFYRYVIQIVITFRPFLNNKVLVA